MAVKKESDYTTECGVFFEHSIASGDMCYLVIFGYHINGAYICVPNWSVGCEASIVPESTLFNQEQLIKAGMNEGAARVIAEYIDSWMETHKELVQGIRKESQERLMKRIGDLQPLNNK